jgi:D-serine deaminase-like pyridoxal phosphate-dependent protein
MKISDIYQEQVDFTHKGFSRKSIGKTFSELMADAPSLFGGHFTTPIATLKQSALANNISAMSKYCEEIGFELAPHVKTHMSPQLATEQVKFGAKYLTVATMWQARVFLEFGFKSIIIANEVSEILDLSEIAEINRDPLYEVICYVDSLAGAKLISDALANTPSGSIHLLVEIGYKNGRGGVRDLNDIKALCESLVEIPGVIIRGVTGFEGNISGERTPEKISEIESFCNLITAAASLVSEYVHRPELIISAGGSGFFDVVVKAFNKFSSTTHRVRRILRSGGYISFDDGFYGRISPSGGNAPKFEAAIEVWGSVVSQAESGLTLLNFGKRDVGIDLDNPIPSRSPQKRNVLGTITKLNDQHAFLIGAPGTEMKVGEWIACCISHPCTTFDKWRIFPVLDEQDRVIDYIRTYF